MSYALTKLLSRSETIARTLFKIQGYNKFGLYHDDLIEGCNETINPEVTEAYRRMLLEHPEMHDQRVFRALRAFQLNLQKKHLPEDQWISYEEDQTKGRYLTKYLQQIREEQQERKRIEDEDASM